MPVLLDIVDELVAQADRRPMRNGRAPTIERGRHRPRQDRAIEVRMPGQYPQIEEILHPAIEHAQRGQRLQLFPESRPTEEIGIVGGSVWHIEPQIEQQCSLEQELVALFREAQAIEHALQCISGQHQVVVQIFATRLVEQPVQDGGSDVPNAHARLSR